MISVFDIFKIGIGPSSSHTVGPMKAGKQFSDDLIEQGILRDVTRVVVDVYGSLSLTGKGHHTDIAIIMGLAGNLPDTVDIDAIPHFIQDVNTHGRLLLANGQHEVEFPVDCCMNFHADNLALHENGMRITALAGDKVLYYFDPPYRPLSSTASFTSYSKEDFDEKAQICLAEFCRRINTKGAKFLLSNSDPKNENPKDHFFEDHYKQFRIDRVKASRMINCKASGRGQISELLITNY